MTTLNLITATDWELIVAIAHWNSKPDIDGRLHTELYNNGYKFTDAYGPVGHIPEGEGRNWSAWRDSSPEAKRLIANYIRVQLALRGVTELRYC